MNAELGGTAAWYYLADGNHGEGINDQRPYNPQLLCGLRQRLAGRGIVFHPFGGDRAGSYDLLLRADGQPVETAFLVESYSPYMGGNQRDLEFQVHTLNAAAKRPKRIIAAMPFVELRDENPDFRDAEPLVVHYGRTLAAADQNNLISTLAALEQHSRAGTDMFKQTIREARMTYAVRRLYDRYQQEEISTNSFLRSLKRIEEETPDVSFVPLSTMPDFVAEIGPEVAKHPQDFISIALDPGALWRARYVSRMLRIPLALFQKSRPGVGQVQFGHLFVADPETGLAVPADPEILRGKIGIGPDDIFGTTGTSVTAGEIAKNHFHLDEFWVYAAHGAFIHPQAQTCLGMALKKGLVDRAYISTSLRTAYQTPQITMDAEEAEILLRAALGDLSTEEWHALQETYLHGLKQEYAAADDPKADPLRQMHEDVCRGNLGALPYRSEVIYSGGVTGVRPIPITEPLALFMLTQSGLATPDEQRRYDQYVFDPGPPKKTIVEQLHKGELILDGPYAGVPYGNSGILADFRKR